MLTLLTRAVCVAVRLLVATIQKCCFINVCILCDYCISLTDVKGTRRKLASHIMNMKVGVWINEADSDDERKYRPLPLEQSLMRTVNYELANIVNI